MSSPSSSWIIPAAAAAATVVGVTLTALQSDSFRWLFRPEQLQGKRAAEYRYRWNHAISRAILRLQYAWAGGSIQEYNAEEELAQTILWDDVKQVKEFCREKVTANATLKVIRVGKDDRREDTREHYVWFVEAGSSSTKPALHQIPLALVATVLADHLERQITTATFCFVADASAHQGSRLLIDLLQTTPEKESIMVLEQPFWLTCLAVIVEQGIYTKSTLERALFALCRVEANRGGKGTTTVLVTLPGQSVVPQLLPLVHKVFPDDRLCFMYTGCIKTVKTAITFRRKAKKTSTAVPKSLDQENALYMTDPVVVTTPLAPERLHQSTNIMTPFTKALAALPAKQADTVQTWMAAVDSYLVMKEEDGKKNIFLPYCCKLDFLFAESIDCSEKNSSYLALRSLIQYVTGTRTREVPTATMQAAAKCVSVMTEQWQKECNTNKVEENAIEEAVFQHKLILIENKIIFDSVLPAEHWTLKAAVKQGCACCLPEEDEGEEEENKSKLDMSDIPGAFAMSSGPRQRKTNGGYVDGKSSFAFDPTRFL